VSGDIALPRGEPGNVVGGGEHLAAGRLQADPGAQQAGGHPFGYASALFLTAAGTWPGVLIDSG
jgi:hypothetical protein